MMIQINKKMQDLYIEDANLTMNNYIRLLSDIITDRLLSGSKEHGCIPTRHKLTPTELSKYIDVLLNINIDPYDIHEAMSHKLNLNITKGKKYKQVF